MDYEQAFRKLQTKIQTIVDDMEAGVRARKELGLTSDYSHGRSEGLADSAHRLREALRLAEVPSTPRCAGPLATGQEHELDYLTELANWQPPALEIEP